MAQERKAKRRTGGRRQDAQVRRGGKTSSTRRGGNAQPGRDNPGQAIESGEPRLTGRGAR